MKDIFAINKGIIEADAFHLLGASSKREDSSKIGYFGSGVKYAIAWLLRNKIDFKVYSDGKEIKFGLVKKELRGKEFDVITINKKPTSITTEMGPEWNGWFAIREIVCNALDEDEGVYGLTDAEMTPQKGMTFFLIKGSEKFKDFIENENMFLSFKRRDAYNDLTGFGKLYPALSDKEGLIVYRKGVQCYNSPNTKAIFNYEFDNIDINESRVVKDTWKMYHQCWDLLNGSSVEAKRKFIDKVGKDYFEEHLRVGYHAEIREDWLQAMHGYIIIPPWMPTRFLKDVDISLVRVMPEHIYEAFDNRFGASLPKVKGMKEERMIVEPDEYQETQLKEAMDLLQKVGFKITHPIKFALFRSATTLGEASDGVIFISPAALESGIFVTSSVLLEEQFHLDSSMEDMTRGFQNYIFTKMLRELVKSKGIIV